MNKEIREQIRFALQDDNELMTAALHEGSDLAEENKRLNRLLIKSHEAILAKLYRSDALTQDDLRLIRSANQIHLNDRDNLNGRHKEAVELDHWLQQRMELTKDRAMRILEEYLDRDSQTPAEVYRALHTLWEEATPNDVVEEPTFDDEGRCLKCAGKISFADVTDTLVFVGDEIVKRCPGDITNRNCVRCTYPEQYRDLQHFESDGL